MMKLFSILFLLLIACNDSTKPNKTIKESEVGSKSISENAEKNPVEKIVIPDTCFFRPVVKRINTPRDDGSQDEIHFYLNEESKSSLYHYSHLTQSSSCNDVGLGISNHEIKEDTLRIYTFWCHIGDPTGHEWGARIMTYVWDCSTASLKKIDSRLHVEMQGDMGGFALDPGYNDPEMVQERERFKRDMERIHKGKFVIGDEAEALIKRTKKFLKKDIKEITDHFIPMFENSFGYQI